MRKYIILLIFLFILFFVFVWLVVVFFCCNDKGNKICIFNIKCSVKNYWEYRVEVSINGVRKLLEIYNCWI